MSVARAALKEQQRLVDENPNNPDYHHELARIHNNLGIFLQKQGKWAESWDEYRVALAQQQSLAEEYPNVPLYRHFLARTHYDLGGFLASLDQRGHVADDLGDFLAGGERAQEAEAEYRTALTEQWRLVAEHPNVPVYRLYLDDSRVNLVILCLLYTSELPTKA